MLQFGPFWDSQLTNQLSYTDNAQKSAEQTTDLYQLQLKEFQQTNLLTEHQR
jgi:hypothetical protein